MGLPRSTYYDAPPVKTDDAEIVANITAICDEFEAYGYRRVGAAPYTPNYATIGQHRNTATDCRRPLRNLLARDVRSAVQEKR